MPQAIPFTVTRAPAGSVVTTSSVTAFAGGGGSTTSVGAAALTSDAGTASVLALDADAALCEGVGAGATGSTRTGCTATGWAARWVIAYPRADTATIPSAAVAYRRMSDAVSLPDSRAVPRTSADLKAGSSLSSSVF